MTVSVKRTFCLIGHPVGHSLSPAIHRAAYAELGLVDCEYETRDCPDEASVRSVFDALRSGAIAGANVTVPWKRLALELADDVDRPARDTGAVNVLLATGSGASREISAFNTDAPALAEELNRGRPGARSAAIVGKGGAALGAVSACRLLGIEDIVLVARGWTEGARGAWAGATEFEALGVRTVAWPAAGDSEWRRAVAAADLVVQATSDGMHGASDGSQVRGVVPWEAVPRDAFVYDVVYNPKVTPFVAAAREHGLRAETGLGMLVGQAVLAIERWLGQRPAALPLLRAAEHALAEKTRR
jgi:shikimate dehydrogenase